MVAGDKLPPQLQDKVLETYELPLVGRIEIRQDLRTQEYSGWISGHRLVCRDAPKDLTAIRDLIGESALAVASEIYNGAKRQYDKIDGPYSELMLKYKCASASDQNWLDRFKK